MSTQEIVSELQSLINKLDDSREQQLLKSVLLSTRGSLLSGNIDKLCELTTGLAMEYIRQIAYSRWVEKG